MTTPGSALSEAIAISATYHAQQFDKGGEPYIMHALSVMLRVRESGGDEATQIAAVLHDAVEDTNLSLSEVGGLFGESVREAVDALSRRHGELYRHYIQRLNANPTARAIKIADIHDNLDPRRQKWAKDDNTIAQLQRLRERYQEALKVLEAS